MKKIIITTAVIFFSMAGIADAAPDSNSIIRNGIEYYMQTDKSVYHLGEQVEMLYRVTNRRDQDVTVNFTDQVQYYFTVKDGGNLIWDAPKAGLPALSSFTLQPGSSKEYSENWDMLNNQGILVYPTNYELTGSLHPVLLFEEDKDKYVPVSVSIDVIQEPATYYVNPGESIQDVIDDLNVVGGDEIIVAEGTYFENINFNGKNIILRTTDPNNPDIVAATIIDGQLGGSVVTFAGTESPACVLSGFTITNGRGTGVGNNYGGGIYGNGTLATIQYNIISGNRTLSPLWPSSGSGGGLYDCDGIIQYNIISENGATCNEGGANGGGLYGCDGTIQKNVISGNSASGFSAGWGDIEGGGLSNCNATIRNNVIVGNYASGWWGDAKGGGLSNCNGTIQNNTIFDNYTEETRTGFMDHGGGLSNCSGTIINCIIWQNTADQGAQLYASSTPSYSCIQDWSGDSIGNISNDPCLVSSGYWDVNAIWIDGDYHLRRNSPCVDAGDPNYIPEPNETDLDGNPRVIGDAIDMGAYETNYIEAQMKLTPQMLNCNSKGKYVKAHLTLPEGFLPEDVDVNEPAMAEPMGIESEYIKVLGAGTGPVRLEICFDREAFCAQITETGEVEITVIGSLTISRYFYATDTIKIKP